MNFIFAQIKRAFRKLTPLEMMMTELAEAELSLLEHQSCVEYHQAIAAYNRSRIERLRKATNSHAKQASSV